jgi:hypothetical protein
VADNAIPCIIASNTLAHWSPEGRTGLIDLIRRLGARRDLVCIVKEGYAAGLGLFTGRPDEPTDGETPYEVLGAAVFLSGRERLFRLGSGELHGVGLTWSPTPVPANQ